MGSRQKQTLGKIDLWIHDPETNSRKLNTGSMDLVLCSLCVSLER